MEAELWQQPKGLRAPLAANTVIGRSPDADIKVFSARVSREHCMIRQQANGFWLYDLNSANGTQLNDRDVSQPTQLNHGDVIGVADITFRFHVPGQTSTIGDEGDLSEEPPMATVIGVRETPIVILVADIVNFSSMSDKLSSEELGQFLNAWYEDCRRIIDASGGVIDKFMGDGMFAYWKHTGPEFRELAINCAKELSVPTQFPDEVRQLLEKHEIDVRCGIGLHIGSAAVGAVARGTRTALGDPVNIAFRIETATRATTSPVLASGEFFSGWEDGLAGFESCGVHELKGYGDMELFGLKGA